MLWFCREVVVIVIVSSSTNNINKQHFEVKYCKNCVHFFKSAKWLVYPCFWYMCFLRSQWAHWWEIVLFGSCRWVKLLGHIPISDADFQQRESAPEFAFEFIQISPHKRLLSPAVIYLLPSPVVSRRVQGHAVQLCFPRQAEKVIIPAC